MTKIVVLADLTQNGKNYQPTYYDVSVNPIYV